MTFSVHGLAVARGIAIGRAVLVASSRVDVAHYFVKPEQVEGEIERVRNGRNAVVEELQRLQTDMPADAPHELTALLDVHLVLVAHALSPADMLQFKQSVFAGFVTDVGGKTSHTAIVARSMDIPAVVGARAASQLVRQDDWVIIDGDAGVVIVDPSPIILAEYGFRQRQVELERERLARLRHTPAITIDGPKIELLANIEQPGDAAPAVRAGAVGVGLFRSEFLFMGKTGNLPGEDEQYRAYCEAIDGMQGLPVTIRTIDVGADKPLDHKSHKDNYLNPALGLRAIRWSLADPAMFRTQLRAVLRAASHGKVNLLFPMLAHTHEIQQTLAQVDLARGELDARGEPYGPVQLGAMIEVPAAALRLVGDVIAEGERQGKSVCVCGETAGDVTMTRLLLGLGLRSFSMHPAQILAVKQEVLRADTRKLAPWAQQVLEGDEPAALLSS